LIHLEATPKSTYDQWHNWWSLKRSDMGPPSRWHCKLSRSNDMLRSKWIVLITSKLETNKIKTTPLDQHTWGYLSNLKLVDANWAIISTIQILCLTMTCKMSNFTAQKKLILLTQLHIANTMHFPRALVHTKWNKQICIFILK